MNQSAQSDAVRRMEGRQALRERISRLAEGGFFMKASSFPRIAVRNVPLLYIRLNSYTQLVKSPIGRGSGRPACMSAAPE